jgi:ankyrin repeat protein
MDDCGRTPLHDACWTSTPNPDLMTLLITEAPELLLVSDKRGHAPLQFAQRIDYPTWIAYLQQHENDIVRLIHEANQQPIDIALEENDQGSTSELRKNWKLYDCSDKCHTMLRMK